MISEHADEDTGRDVYLQSGVVAFKGDSHGFRILLVSSNNGKRWVLPKGLIEPDLTPAESAAREAYEEAGIRGEVIPEVIGTYSYEKWGGTCRMRLYPMRVTGILDTWPEDDCRTRRWIEPDQLPHLLDERLPRPLARAIPERLRPFLA
jgi:8-oxo-dGTP pyrophosphatase MutT (NUDIX family)